MRKYLVFSIVLIIVFIFNPLFVLADESFVFTENFNSTYRINKDRSRVKIEDGKVFVADDAVASRIESTRIGRSYYGITGVALSAAQNLPSGSRIIFYVSNNGGNNWIQVESNEALYNFPPGSDNLRWAAVLARGSNGASPYIDTVRIVFYNDSAYSSNSNSGNPSNSRFLGDFYDDVGLSVARILGFGAPTGAVSYTGNVNNSVNYILPQTYSASNGQNNVLAKISGDVNVISQNTRLLRLNGSADVYYITEKGLKRKIPNLEVFNSYNDKWGDVAVVNWEVLSKYPDNMYIFLKNGKNPRQVYKIVNGGKIFVSEAEIKRLGIKDNEIAPVNKTEFDYYK